MPKRMFRGWRAAAALDKAIRDGLPSPLLAPCRYLVTGAFPDDSSRRVAEAVEARRDEISAMRDPVEIIYSPEPGSVTDWDRPSEGETLLFSPARVASTGKSARWGGFLYLVAREFGCRSGIELGACAGLSAYYLGSAVERLVTVEGSAALADIARETVAPLPGVRVVNALFNDALDAVGEDRFDLAYIDGHHEQMATLRYFERLQPSLEPGGVILFDDISWSQDMRDGWERVCAMPDLSDCVDLGEVGLCIWRPGVAKARVWDLRRIAGSRGVGRPHGWGRKPMELVE